jgi:tRNA A-37 threonylcarbamoyl transferase component Bud32
MHVSDPLNQGPYRLVRRLAVGGMGEVLLAETEGDVRVGLGEGLVVIKRTLPKHPNQDHQNSMLREEARLSLRLRHGNLVETFALDQVDDTPLLVMEYLAGRSMAQVLGAAKRTKQLVPIDVAVKIIHDAACGLHFAHTLKEGDRLAGLVHRDVSPANIFVTFDGRVKVIDFGVAKADDSEIKTSTGVLKGKIGYMSPEHTLGEKLDPRSDLWSLGVLLWEALIAERLFASQNPALTLHKINNAEIVRPSVRRPDIPKSVDDLVMRLLTRDKAERVGSGAELVRLIEGIKDVDWRVADLSGFLMTRFPDEAARGQAEAARAATVFDAPPVPTGLVTGHASAEGGIDEEVATIVANSRDLIELARRVTAEDALDDDEARTVQMSAAEVAELTGKLASAPPVRGGYDAGGKTEPLFGGAGGASIADMSTAPHAQRDPSELATDPEAKTVLRTPEEIDALLKEDDPASNSVMTRPPSIDGPRDSELAPTRPAKSGPVAVAGQASGGPSGSGVQQRSADGRRAPARRASRGPSATAVAFGTFGVLATAMGLIFGLVQAPRDPLVVAWTTPSGAEVVAARIDAPQDPAINVRKVDLAKPWMVMTRGGGAVFLDKTSFDAKLKSSGVWARADLPYTARSRFSAALPPLFIVLGLLALAWALPSFLTRGSAAWGLRAALIAGAVALGGAGLYSGLLGWPGMSRFSAPPGQIEAHEIPAAGAAVDGASKTQ